MFFKYIIIIKRGGSNGCNRALRYNNYIFEKRYNI